MPTNKKFYSGKIPFSSNPKEKLQLDYEMYFYEYIKAEDRYAKNPPIWKENIPFIANIKIESYSRGRSAANWSAKLYDVYCSDKEYEAFLQECEVNIFMVDMLDIIHNSDLIMGVSNSLKLAFCKRGSNYGLCLYHGDIE